MGRQLDRDARDNRGTPMIDAPSNNLEAFTAALELSLTAPTEGQALKAIMLAHDFAQRLEPEQREYIRTLLKKGAKRQG